MGPSGGQTGVARPLAARCSTIFGYVPCQTHATGFGSMPDVTITPAVSTGGSSSTSGVLNPNPAGCVGSIYSRDLGSRSRRGLSGSTAGQVIEMEAAAPASARPGPLGARENAPRLGSAHEQEPGPTGPGQASSGPCGVPLPGPLFPCAWRPPRHPRLV